MTKEFEARLAAVELEVARLAAEVARVSTIESELSRLSGNVASDGGRWGEALVTLKGEVGKVRDAVHQIRNDLSPLVVERKRLRRRIDSLDAFAAEFRAFRALVSTIALGGVVLVPLLAAVAVEATRGHLDVTATAAAIAGVLSALGYAREKRKGVAPAHHTHAPPAPRSAEAVADVGDEDEGDELEV